MSELLARLGFKRELDKLDAKALRNDWSHLVAAILASVLVEKVASNWTNERPKRSFQSTQIFKFVQLVL